EVANALGDYQTALAAAVDAIALLPSLPQFDDIAFDAASASPSPTVARAELERALGYKDTATLRIALARVDLQVVDVDHDRTSARRALELDPTKAEAIELLRI